MAALTPLSYELIQTAIAGVDTGVFGSDVYYYTETGSTNDRAREAAINNAPHGSIFVTDYQSAGRGRMGRVWVAPPNTNLLMTTLFRPEGLPPDQVNRLVMVCGLAITDTFESLGSGDVTIKWPNDLRLSGKKFAGILPESSVRDGKFEWVAVGTGINVNQTFEGDLADIATSLRVETGRVHDRAALLASILKHVSRWYNVLNDVILLDTWRSRCETIGQSIQIRLGDELIEGSADDIEPDGALLLRLHDGRVRRLTAGETTLNI